jgi:putative membrane protein
MTNAEEHRKPRTFSPDDPKVVSQAGPTNDSPISAIPSERGEPEIRRPTASDLQRGFRWGMMFLSTMASLAALAAGLAFTRFVSDALARQDWIGWTATTLAGLAVLSAAVILWRELIGLLRLTRLGHLKGDVTDVIAKPDLAKERRIVSKLKSLLGANNALKWGIARLTEHEKDVRDPGELLRLAERELLTRLDRDARSQILKSAKRVSMVTALSPFVWVAMIYVLLENLRLLRGLATLYGGRPGFAGSVRLARLVVGHIVATGGIALTDDVLGQFLGQDLLRRFSRRLGEGAFNGALTARIGAAAVEVIRPLPFMEAAPVRARDILPELFKSWTAKAPGAR